MEQKQHKKLLLIGPSKSSVHLKNFYDLIHRYFDDVLIITEWEIDFCAHKVIDFSIKNPLKFLRNTKRMKAAIEAYKPSLIHVHQANSCAYMAVRANTLKIPLVLTCWGSDVLLLPHKNWFFKFIVRQSLKNASIITADANFMIEAIKELGIKTPTYLANFGIEYTEIVFPEKENIIYSNRLHKELYNIDKIIRGVADFLHTNHDWKLVIGASGPQTDNLKELANELLPTNAYEFIGFVDKSENIKQYLKSKIYISIPKSDGTAISLLEAMGYGCVPIVSDLPANKEWIQHNENGIINTSSLSISLSQALQLDFKTVQAINKTIVLEKATKKVGRDNFVKIYKSLIKT